MSFNSEQFRELIKETLQEVESETSGKIRMTEEAVDLLMMTAAHESLLGTFIVQCGGPAKGPFQMETLTHDDHWDYIDNRRWLREAMREMAFMEEADAMEWNLKYAIVMARIHYYRKPEKLPKGTQEDYWVLLSEYCKQHYNTVLGKATPEKYLEDYYKYCT